VALCIKVETQAVFRQSRAGILPRAAPENVNLPIGGLPCWLNCPSALRAIASGERSRKPAGSPVHTCWSQMSSGATGVRVVPFWRAFSFPLDACDSHPLPVWRVADPK